MSKKVKINFFQFFFNWSLYNKIYNKSGYIIDLQTYNIYPEKIGS
jgi:hypothetical protein